ncbi:MAG TPA: hypothetical protein PKV71_01095 [Calditrichia bacterium]|nr:hypothetical protein [Calditrichota bacterium]HQU70993.1 hypothetical protein [Calditrichia bacterium]HQV30435.1 hypothetical protein [Calditrichia bacterium]
MIRLSTVEDLIAKPLFDALFTSPLGENFELSVHDSAENARLLIDEKIDVAVLSVLDFARNSNHFSLLRDLPVSSEGDSRAALLFFRENQMNLGKVGIFKRATQYEILTRIVLNEFFELDFEWEESSSFSTLEETLNTLPACLLEGEPALRNFPLVDSYLDLASEWSDKTEMPYVHYVVAVRREWDDPALRETLVKSREVGVRNLNAIATRHAEGSGLTWDIFFEVLNSLYQYYPNEDVWQMVRQYSEYLFYYGELDYLPEVHLI